MAYNSVQDRLVGELCLKHSERAQASPTLFFFFYFIIAKITQEHYLVFLDGVREKVPRLDGTTMTLNLL